MCISIKNTKFHNLKWKDEQCQNNKMPVLHIKHSSIGTLQDDTSHVIYTAEKQHSED